MKKYKFNLEVIKEVTNNPARRDGVIGKNATFAVSKTKARGNSSLYFQCDYRHSMG